METLDAQDYDNIEILIWDDDPESGFDTRLLESLLVHHPYRYEKAEQNFGYSRAFQHLTMEAEGTYIAYCDQDDRWMKNKISRCVQTLEAEKAVLVTTDRAIIDEKDRVVVKSCRRQQKGVGNGWNTGDAIVRTAVFHTCALGMSIVMRTDVARELLPIPVWEAHDRWLTAGACVKGRVAYLDEVLVQYRRHSENVSGLLTGIHTKEEYYWKRILPACCTARAFVRRFPEVSWADRCAILRFASARKKGNIKEIYRQRHLTPNVAWFEICFNLVPERVFEIGLKLLKKRVKFEKY